MVLFVGASPPLKKNCLSCEKITWTEISEMHYTYLGRNKIDKQNKSLNRDDFSSTMLIYDDFWLKLFSRLIPGSISISKTHRVGPEHIMLLDRLINP